MAHLDMKKCCKVFGDDNYCLLAVFLAYTEALQMIHHSHHWQTHGEVYFADHQLFERLYTGTGESIDPVGEKLVGLSQKEELTNYFTRMTVMRHFLEACTDTTKSYMEVSLLAEKMYLGAGEKIINSLKEKGLLTHGLEQMLGDILDKHEGFVYLLEQRLK